MRVHEIISERVFDQIGIAKTPIFLNPSKAEFDALASRVNLDSFDAIRALLDPSTQDIYVWDGHYAAHGGIKDRYGVGHALHLLLSPRKVTVLTLWRYERDGLSAEDIQTLVETNRNLKGIYRGPFEVVLQP